MLQSMKSITFSVLGASALTLGFGAMPTLALTLGIPSQALNNGVGWSAPATFVPSVFPTNNPRGFNFPTNEFYRTTEGGPLINNPNFVQITAFQSTTSGPVSLTSAIIANLLDFRVNFDYSLPNTRGSFGIVDSLNVFTKVTDTGEAPGQSDVIGDFTTGNLVSFLKPGSNRFEFRTTNDTFRFSNFNYTTTQRPPGNEVPFEFNPAVGLILTGALFGGSKLLKKRNKSAKIS